MTTKEKLQKIASMIGMYELRISHAQATGNYSEVHICRGARQLAKKEFARLSRKEAK